MKTAHSKKALSTLMAKAAAEDEDEDEDGDGGAAGGSVPVVAAGALLSTATAAAAPAAEAADPDMLLAPVLQCVYPTCGTVTVRRGTGVLGRDL